MFLFFKVPIVWRPTQPPTEWVKRAFFLAGLKRLRYEANRSPPTSTRVTNSWSYTTTLPYALSVLWHLIKHRENLAFTFPKLRATSYAKNKVYSSSAKLEHDKNCTRANKAGQ